MINPTPGRIVWYRPHPEKDAIPQCQSERPLAAMIAGVHADGRVNLSVTGFDGSGPYARKDVHLVQDPNTAPEQGQACWMPYQHGQSAKAEQLEDKLKAVHDAGMAARAAEFEQRQPSQEPPKNESGPVQEN